MEPTESTLVTWSKFDPPLWGKRWDGLPAFTHTRNHSLTDTWALLPGFRPSWSNCTTLWDYCLCLAQDILLPEKLPPQVRKAWFGILSCPNERSILLSIGESQAQNGFVNLQFFWRTSPTFRPGLLFCSDRWFSTINKSYWLYPKKQKQSQKSTSFINIFLYPRKLSFFCSKAHPKLSISDCLCALISCFSWSSSFVWISCALWKKSGL